LSGLSCDVADDFGGFEQVASVAGDPLGLGEFTNRRDALGGGDGVVLADEALVNVTNAKQIELFASFCRMVGDEGAGSGGSHWT
jgi:hypothetical protein